VPAPRRRLDDPRTIRALAHPLRLHLLQLLLQRGPLTATEAGDLVGESPASASFHLRQLARYGYVEEAGGGTGRRRPWRAVDEVQELPVAGLTGEAALAASELDRVLAVRSATLHDGWLQTRGSYPADWQRAATETNAVLRLTLEQAQELRERLRAVLDDYLPSGGSAPADSVPIALLLSVFPLEHPA